MHEHTPSRAVVRDTLTGSADATWRARLGERTLDQLGWVRAARRIDPGVLEDPGRIVGRVVRVDCGRMLLVACGGAPPLHVHDRIAGDDPTVVGDWVVIDRPAADGPGIARSLVERDGVLARRDGEDSSRPQLVAANVDLVLVAEALDPERRINEARVARFTAIAAAGGSGVRVLLTGVDRLADRTMPDEVAGVPALATSIVDSTGLDELRDLLSPGTTAVVVGASGAGKSSLVNALLGEPVLAVAERRDSGTGRHTTAASRVVPLPGGALLIDTPGVRLVGMHAGVDPGTAMPNRIGALAADCRFRDCRHADEPGCAVTAAIDQGELDESWLLTWRRLEREALRERARSDERLRRELRDEQSARGRAYTRARRRGEIRPKRT